MHATVRRIKTNPGQAGTVGELIEAEYLPLIEGHDGFVGYTLVDLGNDEVCSIGVFDSDADADAANTAAKSWTAERLAPYVASPLDVAAGAVLVHRRSEH